MSATGWAVLGIVITLVVALIIFLLPVILAFLKGSRNVIEKRIPLNANEVDY